MLKLATILDNAGEPQSNTRYRDPNELLSLGYNGAVLYQTTALSGMDSADRVASSEMRRWVEQQFEQITSEIHRLTDAGLNVYIAFDMLCLARQTLERDAAGLACRNRPGTICPASDAAVERCVGALGALLDRWPQVTGVVLRFGDNDAARLPYLVGNDIYQPHCPRCSELSSADRVLRVLGAVHKLVVEQRKQTLIARAWNVRPDGLHDSVDLCEQVRKGLTGVGIPEPAGKDSGDGASGRFILSFKFSETDFWRYQRWNRASRAWGDRPVMYELQCQREFEGKGGVPNWQPPLWRDGFNEMGDEGSADRGGLAHVAGEVNLAGLWAWVRGGGWGGPFIKHEAWIDANVVAVPKLADDPKADLDVLAKGWIADRLGIDDAATQGILLRLLEHSPAVVRQGFYVEPFARKGANRWHPNGDWIQDDLIDAEAAWRMVRRIDEAQLELAVREKEQAVEAIARDRRALEEVVNAGNRSVLDPLVNSLLYTQSLLETLRDLIAGLVSYRRFLAKRDGTHAEQAKQRLSHAQSSWNHHTQRHGSLPGAATTFRESHLWELTQRILDELSN